jgi:hypothetical protein
MLRYEPSSPSEAAKDQGDFCRRTGKHRYRNRESATNGATGPHAAARPNVPSAKRERPDREQLKKGWSDRAEKLAAGGGAANAQLPGASVGPTQTVRRPFRWRPVSLTVEPLARLSAPGRRG